MTRKHGFGNAKNHPLVQTLQEFDPGVTGYDPNLKVLSMTHFWALTNFIQYGLDCAVKDSRPSADTDAPPAKSREWLRDQVEGAVLCLKLARDSVDTFVDHG